jgi:hypothetical protein
MEWQFAPKVNIIPGISHNNNIIGILRSKVREESSNHHNKKPRNKLKDGGPLQEWVIGKEPLVHATFVLHIWWEAWPCLLNPQPTPGHHESPGR